MVSFNSIISVAELAGLVMDHMTLPALTAFSFTSKTNYVRVQDHSHRKLRRILSPLGFPAESVLATLSSASAIIVGSIALKAVSPIDPLIYADTLDIVVAKRHLPAIKAWLTQSFAFGQPTVSPLACTPIPFIRCHKYKRDFDGRQVGVNVYTVADQSAVYEFPFYSASTSTMNFITGSGVYTGYRTLLNRRFAIRSRSVRMAGFMIGSIRGQIINDNLQLRKAQDRQFTFIEPTPASHSEDSCLCQFDSACPSTLRNTRDNMGAYLRLLNAQDRNAIADEGARIPRTGMRPPLVSWKLAAGQEWGFAFQLTEDRLRRLHVI